LRIELPFLAYELSLALQVLASKPKNKFQTVNVIYRGAYVMTKITNKSTSKAGLHDAEGPLYFTI